MSGDNKEASSSSRRRKRRAANPQQGGKDAGNGAHQAGESSRKNQNKNKMAPQKRRSGCCSSLFFYLFLAVGIATLFSNLGEINRIYEEKVPVHIQEKISDSITTVKTVTISGAEKVVKVYEENVPENVRKPVREAYQKVSSALSRDRITKVYEEYVPANVRTQIVSFWTSVKENVVAFIKILNREDLIRLYKEKVPENVRTVLADAWQGFYNLLFRAYSACTWENISLLYRKALPENVRAFISETWEPIGVALKPYWENLKSNCKRVLLMVREYLRGIKIGDTGLEEALFSSETDENGNEKRETMEKMKMVVDKVNEKIKAQEEKNKEDKKAEEARKAAERAQKAAEEAKKAEEARKAAEEAKKAEEARKAAEQAQKAAEEAKKAEEARKAAEEAKKAEEARKAEEAKKAKEARKAAEEAKKAEEARKAAEEAKKAEEARKAAEEAKKAEEARKAAEEARKAEEAKKVEEAKKAAEAKKVEEAKKAAEAKKAEENRKAEEAKKVAEEAEKIRKAEEAKKTAETKKASEKTAKNEDIKQSAKSKDQSQEDRERAKRDMEEKIRRKKEEGLEKVVESPLDRNAGDEIASKKKEDDKTKKKPPKTDENRIHAAKKAAEMAKERAKEKETEGKNLALDQTSHVLAESQKTEDSNAKEAKLLAQLERLIDTKPQEAYRKFEELILRKEVTNIARATLGKAKCADRLSEMRRSNPLLEQAISLYESVLDLPNVPDEIFLAAARRGADRMKFRGWNPKALKVYKRILEKFPDDRDTLNSLGTQFLIQGQNSAAKDVFEQVLNAHPDDAYATLHLGFALKSTSKSNEELERAAIVLKKGIEKDEKADGKFYYHLGEALQRLGRNSEADEVYQKGASNGIFRSFWQRSLYNVDHLRSKPVWTKEETGQAGALNILEQNWKVIRDEALALLKSDKSGFMPEAENLQDTGDWKQLELYQQGRKLSGCQRVPKTCALLQKVPQATTNKRGQIKFSIMKSGTHVHPHTGPTNCRLRAHLGLVVPTKGDLRLRVADQTLKWKEGKFFIFDDSFDHEVWHYADGDRIVLIVDLWHPDLDEATKASLTAI